MNMTPEIRDIVVSEFRHLLDDLVLEGKDRNYGRIRVGRPALDPAMELRMTFEWVPASTPYVVS